MTLRLGLLSTARINAEILRAAASLETVDVVAVSSRDETRARAYAAEHGLERAHGTYEALLADPEVDAVYVALPNALHLPWSVRALETGKHVLCEKPLGAPPDEIGRAFDVAAERGLVFAEAFMYRHHPQTKRVAELVREGALGRPRAVHALFSFMLRREVDVRLLPELGGGALLDLGTYCVSGARLMAGEPERASGEVVRGPTGIDLAFHGTLRFPDAVVAQFEASFVAPVRQRLEIAGEDALLVVEAPWRIDWGGDVWLVRDGVPERVAVPEADAYREELVDFAAAVRGERPPLLGREDAVAQARALAALARAAEVGRTLPVG